MTARQQPPGARLDGEGNRLWAWSGTGVIEEFYSVTTMIGGGIPKHLQAWYARLVAELAYTDVERLGKRALRRWTSEGKRYLAEQREAGMKLERADETPRGLALRWLKGEPERFRDLRADEGEDIHDAAEALVLEHAREGARLYAATGELPVYPDEIAPRMTSFVRFLRDYGPVYLATEARIYNRTRSYAGKGDAFLKVKVPDDWRPDPATGIRWPLIEPGWLRLAVDYKSGRAIYHEVAIQTAAYRNGEFIGHPDGRTELPVPATDGAAVLHLRPRDYRFDLLRSDDRPFRVFLFAREIFAWVSQEARAGTRTWNAGPVPLDLEGALVESLRAAV